MNFDKNKKKAIIAAFLVLTFSARAHDKNLATIPMQV
jgi:hypothetical protein